jgi:hypothetical protein
MDKKYILVEHNGDDASVEAFNYHGQGCEAEVKRLVNAAGTSGGGKHKPEFFRAIKQAGNWIKSRMGR